MESFQIPVFLFFGVNASVTLNWYLCLFAEATFMK